MPEATKPNRDRAGVKLVFNPSSALSPPKQCSFNLVFIPSPPLKLLFPRPVTASIQRRQWHPTPVLFPGKSHGQRSLVGCSPWGCEDSDRTERLNFHFSLSFIGEGNGNPLQCSCLENPRVRVAWWAAIYGVAQRQTRLKRLSSNAVFALCCTAK